MITFGPLKHGTQYLCVSLFYEKLMENNQQSYPNKATGEVNMKFHCINKFGRFMYSLKPIGRTVLVWF